VLVVGAPSDSLRIDAELSQRADRQPEIAVEIVPTHAAVLSLKLHRHGSTLSTSSSLGSLSSLSSLISLIRADGMWIPVTYRP